MNLISWIVLCAVITALIFAVKKIVSSRTSGGCAGCGQCAHAPDPHCRRHK